MTWHNLFTGGSNYAIPFYLNGEIQYSDAPTTNGYKLTYSTTDGITWTADSNTDTKVSFVSTATASNYPILFKYSTGSTTTADSARFNTSIYATPSTGTITATNFNGLASGASQIKIITASPSVRYYIFGGDAGSSTGTLGNLYACFPYIIGSDVFSASDIQLKENIKEVSNDFVDKIFSSYSGIVKEFDWISSHKHATGFVAQELSYIIPEAVDYSYESYTYSVNYNSALSKLVGALLKKTKEQDEEISYLKKCIGELYDIILKK